MCKRLCAGKGEAVADHIIPHRGDEAMFWDADNLQCLCKSCHDGVKAKQERQQGFR
nr:HNH endonuclease [Haematobacter massiliensis]